MIVDTKLIRQSGLVDEAIFQTPVCIIGAGGIGSFTTLALAKCGFKTIDIWDYDKVEEHNLANQFYPIRALGFEKTKALQAEVNEWCEVNINIHGRWKGGNGLKGVVISAVDSMKTRHDIFGVVNRSRSADCLIDGRMGANQLEVYTCNIHNPDDIKLYRKTLCKDEDTANIPCTQRAVMYNVLNIASWITNQARLVLSNKDYKRALIMDLENMILVIPEKRKQINE